ncbi:MAG: hypothetical protein PVI90_18695, partial [Desulfobacteraceae bacterium]
NKKALSWLALAPAFVGGTGAIIGKELIALMARAFGIGDDDPEEAFYDWVADSFGDLGERFARHGAVGLAGINFKGSLAIGVADIPTNLGDLLGAPGSMFLEDPYKMFRAGKRGDYLKAAEHFPVMPNFLANPLRALREREGVTTWSNTPIFYGNEPVVADNAETFLRTLSFSPARLATISEKQWKERKVEAKYLDMRRDIYARFKSFYGKRPNKRSEKEMVSLLVEVKEYNERVKGRGLRQKGIPFITSKSIKNNLRRAFRPPKKERLREAVGQ